VLADYRVLALPSIHFVTTRRTSDGEASSPRSASASALRATGFPFLSTSRQPLLFPPCLNLSFSAILRAMEVNFTSETEKKLKDLAAQSGRATDQLVEDATAVYVEELLQTREMLNGRYDDLKSGKVKPIDGEEFFERLKRREDELIKKHSSQ
jgi:hypothetical protein